MSREANMNEHVQETAIDTKTDDKLPTATIIDNQLRNLNFISTNSRSLQPKIQSLCDYFSELELSFAVITETRLREGRSLHNLEVNLKQRNGLQMMTKTERP